MLMLSLLSGVVIGLLLGLTGGGGSIFAVPLLVYGLDVPAREAVTTSLAGVGAAARWWSGAVEVPTGLLFAVSGMLGAPVGAWISGWLSEPVLLTLLGLLMLGVAVRMWRKGPDAPPAAGDELLAGPTCRRDPEGRLRLTSQCAVLLAVVGATAGVLSGLFGVGGGFVIVPAFVMFSGMGIHRAVATSLLVITLVSMSGLASHLLSGRSYSLELIGPFAVGGVAGMFAGNGLGRRVSGPALQRVFAVAIVAVAVFLIVRNLT